jgi:hypothetical protein
MSGGISEAEIATALNARVDTVVPKLLSAARCDRRFWLIGSVDNEPGQSLKVNRTGHNQGLWTDFSAPDGTDERGGDLIKLVCMVLFGGWSRGKDARSQAFAWAKSFLGFDDLPPERLKTVQRDIAERQAKAIDDAAREEAAKRDRAWQLWRDADGIPRTPAASYLQGRGIDLEQLGKAPGSLRYRPDVWCAERRAKVPAMLAAIIRDGVHVGTHRTYLDISGWSHRDKSGPVKVVKIRDPSSGKLKSHKSSLGRFSGGHIPLWKGERPETLHKLAPGTPVYLSEGIEDGLSIAFKRPTLRVVAGVSLGNMGGLVLPDGMGPLVLIGQNDDTDSPAIAAFERVVQRQQQAGRHVQTIFPPAEFKDFNDWLCGKPKGVA